MNMQINQTKQVSYGATVQGSNPSNPFNQGQVPNYNQGQPPSYQQTEAVDNFAPSVSNPFAFPNAIQEEPVQPYATDAYMHGTAEERGFREY